MKILCCSLASGEGQHWFLVFRSSIDYVEIFDSLGGDLQFFKTYFRIRAIYEYNVTPVQCRGSVLCGPFVVFFIIHRFFNLDLDFLDFLNEYFELDCSKNEKKVADFLEQL